MKIFLYMVSVIVPALVTIIADLFFFYKEKTVRKIVGVSLRDFFFVNLLSLTTIQNFLHEKNLFFPTQHDFAYYGKYIGIAFAMGAVLIIYRAILQKVFIVEKAEPKNKSLAMTVRIISTIFLFLGVAAFMGTVWGKEAFYDVNPDQMLITILSPTTGTDNSIMITALEGPVLSTVAITYVFCLLFFPKRTIKFKSKEKAVTILNDFGRRILCFILSVAVLGGGIAYGAIRFDLGKIVDAYNDESPYIEENYKDPTKVNLQFPEKKRNLIHIYLESIENSYFSKEFGGNMDENLMPYLAELSKEGYSFSHKGENEGYGGPLKTYGGTWSVGSMVNQFFGFPMKVPVGGNSYGKEGNFFPGAVGMGDILATQGYEQTMMIGASAEFGGLDCMFSDHGNFKIMDHKYALDNGMLPEGYSVNWGYEDAKLYEFAKEELTRLAETGKPFHFLMENADSHFPGFAFDGENPIFENTDLPKDYGKTIKFSEKDVVEFVRWIMAQPFYENTTVILIGDHLSMDKTFFEENDFSNYGRTTYNLILNPSPEVADISRDLLYNRAWSNVDMFPTILASIGVKIEGDRLALGTNLFSNEPTLYERDTYGKVTGEFVSRSDFYNKNFLLGKRSYNGENITTY